jgi:D-amino peptidase
VQRTLLLFLAAAALWSQPRNLKVHISVDMEGVAGVVTGEQLAPGGFEYERFRDFMTREAAAAIEAARQAGATEILVADSHGNGQNLLIDLLPAGVRVIRSWPRRLGMMAGIDSSFDAAVFLAYHSSTHNPAGVRAHTISSARLTRIALNGANVSEGAINAAVAGHFGVPVVMISGDDAAIAEVRAVVGPIEAAEVKRSLGFHSADTLTPEEARALIAGKVRAALGRLKDFKPYRMAAPVTVDVTFKSYMPSEVFAYLRIVQRPDSHSIRFVARDMPEASDFLQFLMHYNVALEP